MKRFLILLSAAAAITFYAPAASNAQGIGVQVAPGVGVQIGDPNRPRYRERDIVTATAVVSASAKCAAVRIVAR